MIAAVVAAAFLLVVAVAAWTRRSAGRAERRSVQSYGRALGVLAKVAEGSESHVVVQPREGEATARVHVRPDDEAEVRPAQGAGSDVPPPRVRLQPPSLPGHRLSLGAEPVPASLLPADLHDEAVAPQGGALLGRRAEPAGQDDTGQDDTGQDDTGQDDTGQDDTGQDDTGQDDTGQDDTVLVPVLFAGDPAPETPRARELRSPLPPAREHALRRAATGAAAAVVLGALAVGGYELVSSSTPAVHEPNRRAGSGGAPMTTVPKHPGRSATGGSHTSGIPPTTTPPPASPAKPSALEPTSQSAAVVTYAVPSGSYTIALSASGAGACWVGVEQSVNGPYLWMDTLQPGSSSSYKATGSTVVRVGNPAVLAMEVNGEKVALPPGRTQVYDLTLTPATQASA